MFKFDNCWKCEEMQKIEILSNKTQFDVCKRVCDYSKCDRCLRKLETMKDFNEHPYWSKGNKVPRILLHVYFHNHDIDTHTHE